MTTVWSPLRGSTTHFSFPTHPNHQSWNTCTCKHVSLCHKRSTLCLNVMLLTSPLSYFAKDGTTSLTVRKARSAQIKGQECWPRVKRILLVAAELTLFPDSISSHVSFSKDLLPCLHALRELWVEDFRHCVTQLSDVIGVGRDVSSGFMESFPQCVALSLVNTLH